MLVTSIFSFPHNVFYSIKDINYHLDKVKFLSPGNGLKGFFFRVANTWVGLNPFPNDKISDVTKLKAFADDKLKIREKVISLFDRVENTVGKGENAGYQHFLLFPQCFQKPSSLGSLKVRIVW